MAARGSWWRRMLYLAAIPVVVMVFAYLYVVLTPSPGAQFLEGQREEATKAARLIIQPPPPIAPVRTAGKAAVSSTTTPSASRRGAMPIPSDAPTTDILTRMQEFERKWKAFLPAIHAEYYRVFPTTTGQCMEFAGLWWAGDDRLTSVDVESLPMISYGGAPWSAYDSITSADLRHLNRKRIDAGVGFLARRIIVEHQVPQSESKPTTTDLGPCMREAEELLLSDWTLPDANRPWPFSYRTPVRLGWIAIDAAVRRGDDDRAARLAERILDLLRVDRTFTVANGWTYRLVASNLNQLSRDGAFPSEGLRRVAASLARTRLSPEKLRDLRTLQALHARGVLYQPDPPRESNFWHRLAGGVPEAIVRHAAAPILRRQVDQYLSSYARGDLRGVYNGTKYMEMTESLVMNSPPYYERLTTSPWSVIGRDDCNDLLYKHLPYSSWEDAMQSSNETEFASLVVAAIRYRRDCGRDPASIKDLVPHYVDTAFLPTKDAVWEVVTVPAFVDDPRAAPPSTDPFAATIRAWGISHGHVTRSDERLAFCRFWKTEDWQWDEDGWLRRVKHIPCVRVEVYVPNAMAN